MKIPKDPTKRTEREQEEYIVMHAPTNVRLYRNNTAVGWQGKSKRLENGCMLIENPKPIEAGLCVGSSDRIGWITVEITPEMVGKKVAIFVGMEVKAESGKLRPEQVQFLDRVLQAGGCSGVVRTVEDMMKMFDELYKRLKDGE